MSVPVTEPLPLPLREALSYLPRSVPIEIPHHPFDLWVGLASSGEYLWLNLLRETLHIGLYAQSGAGKDTLLRCWFLTLCGWNKPEEVQFAFLDGKGDWLTPNLAQIAHMFIPPAGGYGREGDQRILEAVQVIDQEAQRRQGLITSANCRTREQYIERTGEPLPLLIVVATDVMTSVAGKVEELLVNLVSKARSLGIRVIVSMQTPTGRDTRWRMNLSTVVAGALQSSSQDTPALGIEAKEMVYRPSQLPSPQERPGVFIVRTGRKQHLVQARTIIEQRQVWVLPARKKKTGDVTCYLLWNGL